MLCYITLFLIINSIASNMRRRGWGEATLPSLSHKEREGDAHAHAYAMLYYAKRRVRRPPCPLYLLEREEEMPMPMPMLCYTMLHHLNCFIININSISSSSDSTRRRGEATLPSLSSKEGGGDVHAYAMLYYAKRSGRRPPCPLSQSF